MTTSTSKTHLAFQQHWPDKDKCAVCEKPWPCPTVTEQDAFVDLAMARLPEIPDARDVAAARACAADCFHKGFSLYDAVRYLNSLEHVNPDMPEDLALRRMAEIDARYPKR